MTTKLNPRQLTIRGLEACGWKLDSTAKTNKYRVYTRDGDDQLYLVGKAGGFRTMRRGEPLTESISLTGGRAHRAYQAVGDPAYRFESVKQAQATFTTIAKGTT
jgi:hypothetical protein